MDDQAITVFDSDDHALQKWIAQHGGYVLTRAAMGRYVLHNSKCPHLSNGMALNLRRQRRRWAEDRGTLAAWAEQETGTKPRLCRPSGQESADDSLTRLIAPIFVAFSLPTVIAFVASKHTGAPWHGVILALLIMATGLFMASLQLSVGPLYEHWDVGSFRALLTFIGIAVVAAALFFLVLPKIDAWWQWVPLGVLLVAGGLPGILAFWLRVSRRPSHRPTD
jgi:hypothetical protein